MDDINSKGFLSKAVVSLAILLLKSCGSSSIANPSVSGSECAFAGRELGDVSELLGAVWSSSARLGPRASSGDVDTVCDSRSPLGVRGACGIEAFREEEVDMLGGKSLGLSMTIKHT